MASHALNDPIFADRKRQRDLEVDLISTKTYASKIETELSFIKREAKIKRLEDQDQNASSALTLTRLHKMEQERKDIASELSEAKQDAREAKQRLKETTSALEDHTKRSEAEIRDLKAKLSQKEQESTETFSEKDYLDKQYDSLKEKYTIEVEGLRSLCSSYELQISHLKDENKRLNEEQMDQNQLRQEIVVLQHKVTSLEGEILLLNTLKQQLGVQRDPIFQNKRLLDENRVLHESCKKKDILEYQVATLEEKLKKADSLREEVAKLEIENESLKSRLSKWEESSDSTLPSSPLTMAHQLLLLQQNELLLKDNLGEKDSQLKVKDCKLQDLKADITTLNDQIAKFQTDIKMKDGHIKRLERKLAFVTKERDGNANVLNSYKLDAGLDQHLKNLLEETQASLERAHKRIKELEKELEVTITSLNRLTAEKGQSTSSS